MDDKRFFCWIPDNEGESAGEIIVAPTLIEAAECYVSDTYQGNREYGEEVVNVKPAGSSLVWAVEVEYETEVVFKAGSKCVLTGYEDD